MRSVINRTVPTYDTQHYYNKTISSILFKIRVSLSKYEVFGDCKTWVYPEMWAVKGGDGDNFCELQVETFKLYCVACGIKDQNTIHRVKLIFNTKNI